MKPQTALSTLVRARGLTKEFNGHTAVNQIDFDILSGEVVGFLGPNGAGKTTTIRILLNLLNPTRGELTLFGLNYTDHRTQILQQMNSSSGSLSLPGKLTVEQSLRVFGDLYGLREPSQRINQLIEQFDLKSLRNRTLFSLSTGQQVRAAMAKAFLNKPRLLLLDEPTASLDPDIADRVRSYLADIVRHENTTVFLTSHNMREVESICTRVLFLNHGKIQAEGSPRELARQSRRSKLRVRTEPAPSQKTAFHCPEGGQVSIKGNEILAEMDERDVGPFLSDLIRKKLKLTYVSVQEPTLEDFFVDTTRNISSPAKLGRSGGA